MKDQTVKHFITLSALVLFAGCAGSGGDGAEGQALWQSIVSHLLEVVVILSTPLLLLLARKLYQFLAQKTSIDLSVQQQEMLNAWLEKGIAYAHEQGRKALKEGKDPLPGDEKKIAAVEFVAEALKNTGAVTLGRDQLAKLVEAHLNLSRPSDERDPKTK